VSGPAAGALALALEQCRAHRAALARQLPLPPDSLHRVLRCPRCGAFNFDARVYEGSLQLGDGGARPCRDLAELLAVLAVQHQGMLRGERPDPCPCGTPAVALSLRAARFFHAMPGSGAELLVELHYEDELPAGVRLGRAPLDGPAAFFDEPSDGAVAAAFGVPLTLAGAWGAVIAAEEGALATVEEGLALVAFPAGAEAFRASFDEALAAEPELRAYGLTARVAADPGWAWIRTAPELAARPDTVMLMLVRHDVLAARLAVLAAGRGVGARRDGDTVWLEDAPVRWPVELATVSEEGLRRGFTLSAMAAAAVAQALDRLETLKTFLGAVEKLRPGVSLAVDGMILTPVWAGVTGRPLDLRVAPFGAIPDPETLDRDLRFHLDEGVAWADPWRVCPCGAARVVTFHRWSRRELAEAGLRPGDLLPVDPADVGGDTVRLFGVGCERHVEYALAPLLPRLPGGRAALVAQAELDLEGVVFTGQIARHHDAAGRAVALVEAPSVVDATAHPRLLAAVARAALGVAGAAHVTTLSRDLAVVAEAGADEGLARRLAEAGPVLWTLTRGAAPVPLEGRYEVDPGVAPAGAFALRGPGGGVDDPARL